MTNRPLIAINLPIIPPLIRLIPKEVNRLVLHAIRTLLIRLDVPQTVRLVPARGENVKRDLASNGVGEAEVGEGLLELGDHGGADVVLLVVSLVVVALGGGGVTPDGRHVDHAVAEFDEGAALDGDVEVRDVVEDPVFSASASTTPSLCEKRNIDAPLRQRIVLLLPDPPDEARARELLAQSVGSQAVLREAKVEEGGDVDGAAELLLLLDEVGAADETDGDLVAELGEELQHFGLCELEGN